MYAAVLTRAHKTIEKKTEKMKRQEEDLDKQEAVLKIRVEDRKRRYNDIIENKVRAAVWVTK
jgi:hypothetical protein